MFSVIVDVLAGLVLEGGVWFARAVGADWKRLRRAARRRRGHCVECDYSLRGNESGVCPECGTKIDDEEADDS